MDWQEVASIVVVAGTAWLLVRSALRQRQRARLRVCGQNCGCTSDALEKLKTESRPDYVTNG